MKADLEVREHNERKRGGINDKFSIYSNCICTYSIIMEIRTETQKMSEKQEDNIINFPQEKVTDEEFNIFMNALLGPYKGGGYNPE
jgi:hypothetical protein